MTDPAQPRATPQEMEDGILKISEKLVDSGYRTKDEIIGAIEDYFEEKETEQTKKQHKSLEVERE